MLARTRLIVTSYVRCLSLQLWLKFGRPFTGVKYDTYVYVFSLMMENAADGTIVCFVLNQRWKCNRCWAEYDSA